MKNINFQVKFHVFCMFEKKACFIPILVNRVGLTSGLITGGCVLTKKPKRAPIRLEYF